MRSLREQASRSFYFFQKAPWGDVDLDPKFHKGLCDFLQFDRHARKAIIAFRGSLKTSTLRAFAAWIGLNCIDWWGYDWSWLWIEQKWDNAVKHHRLFQQKFRVGPQAQLLCDLYEDRIPAGFARWTDTDTVLIKKDSTAENFLSVGSLDSKLEGIHRDGIVMSDLEGADAEKSDVPNEEAWRFLAERAEYLLKNPKRYMMLLDGTVHGPDPLVWKLRDLEAGGSLDNSKRDLWALWWKEILDESGKPQWPSRYDMDYVKEKLALAELSTSARRGVQQQLFLRKWVGVGANFDVQALRKLNWKASYQTGPGGARRMVWLYPAKDVVSENGELKVKTVVKKIRPELCRFTIHWDPAHKDRTERFTRASEYKPSQHAITVIAYTPDCHALLIEYWKAEAPVNVALDNFIRLYLKYAPWMWTYDPVGAQSWIISHLETLERYKHRGLRSVATPWRSRDECRRIARPSSNGSPADKSNRNKEEEILNQLELPVNEGWLHLHETHEAIWSEFERFGQAEDSFDLLDSLAQGPPVWKPAPSEEALKAMAKRRLIRRLQMENEIYTAPWSMPPLDTRPANMTHSQS